MDNKGFNLTQEVDRSTSISTPSPLVTPTLSETRGNFEKCKLQLDLHQIHETEEDNQKSEEKNCNLKENYIESMSLYNNTSNVDKKGDVFNFEDINDTVKTNTDENDMYRNEDNKTNHNVTKPDSVNDNSPRIITEEHCGLKKDDFNNSKGQISSGRSKIKDLKLHIPQTPCSPSTPTPFITGNTNDIPLSRKACGLDNGNKIHMDNNGNSKVFFPRSNTSADVKKVITPTTSPNETKTNITTPTITHRNNGPTYQEERTPTQINNGGSGHHMRHSYSMSHTGKDVHKSIDHHHQHHHQNQQQSSDNPILKSTVKCTKQVPCFETQVSINDPSVGLMTQLTPQTPRPGDFCQCDKTKNAASSGDITKDSKIVKSKVKRTNSSMKHEDSHSVLVDMDYNELSHNGVKPGTDDLADQQQCSNTRKPIYKYSQGLNTSCCSSNQRQICDHHHRYNSHSQHNCHSCAGSYRVDIPSDFTHRQPMKSNKSCYKRLFCRCMLAAIILIALVFGVTFLSLFILTHTQFGRESGVLGDLNSTPAAHAQVDDDKASSFCVPCSALQLTSDVEDDKTEGLRRVGDDCCADDATRMMQIIQVLAEKEVRINEVQRPALPDPRYQFAIGGNQSAALPEYKDRNFYAAHVYLGPVNMGDEDSYESQDTKHRYDAQRDDSDEYEYPDFGDERFKVLKSWSKEPETAVVRKFIEFIPSKGRFRVLRDGIYKVYSHLGVRPQKGNPGNGLVFSQEILKENIQFSSPQVVLQDTQMAPCPDIQTSLACHSSTLDSLLSLRKGDEIFVACSHIDLVVRDLRSSFFGIYRIE